MSQYVIDFDAAPHNGTATSIEAAQSVAPRQEALEQLVLDYLERRGVDGGTCDEAEVALRLSHQTCSPRFTRLSRQGRIIAIGKRKTRSGHNATVWAVV